MEKRLIDRFSADFDKNLKDSKNMQEVFNKAKKDFENVCGFTPYSNYQSYSAARSRDKRKRRH